MVDARRCPCGVDWVGADFDCPSKLNADFGLSVNGVAGIDVEELEVALDVGGKAKLTFTKGLLTAIEID